MGRARGVGRIGARRCARCGGRELRDEAETLSFALPLSGISASVVAPARRCAGCDGVHVESRVMERAQLSVACELADLGVQTGEAMRHMRKALGLRAADLARLLDLTPETISLWETGRVPPNRAAFVALGALVQDAVDGRTTTGERLMALAAAPPRPQVISVRLRRIRRRAPPAGVVPRTRRA
jgi:DNA-binding transcriptional regulator YiaG